MSSSRIHSALKLNQKVVVVYTSKKCSCQSGCPSIYKQNKTKNKTPFFSTSPSWLIPVLLHFIFAR